MLAQPSHAFHQAPQALPVTIEHAVRAQYCDPCCKPHSRSPRLGEVLAEQVTAVDQPQAVHPAPIYMAPSKLVMVDHRRGLIANPPSTRESIGEVVVLNEAVAGEPLIEADLRSHIPASSH